jgi:hypothetical protein
MGFDLINDVVIIMGSIIRNELDETMCTSRFSLKDLRIERGSIQ